MNVSLRARGGGGGVGAAWEAWRAEWAGDV